MIVPRLPEKYFRRALLAGIILSAFAASLLPFSILPTSRQDTVSPVWAQGLKLPTEIKPEYPVDTSTRINPLKTVWGKNVAPTNVLPDYPRPTLVRKDWLNLNGLWDWKRIESQIVDPISTEYWQDLPNPSDPTFSVEEHLGKESTGGKILVPFPIESQLSGVGHYFERFACRRFFTIPNDWPAGHRIILNFGAVDWEATVYINGRYVGRHRGGYDAFSFDITDFLNPQESSNELVVRVFDPTNLGQQSRGKQSSSPSGIWYTSSSGIWQTVWLEPVAPRYLKSLHLTADPDSGVLTLVPQIGGKAGVDLSLFVEVFDGETVVAKAYGGIDGPLLLRFPKENLKFWSPDEPFLYQVRVRLLDRNTAIDQVGSYTAFRKVELVKNALGKTRIQLNGRVLFQVGVIDQGIWPDGLYTAPSDQAMQADIRVAKKLGFNMIRKHVKIEPERWYFACDRIGMLVWQDMPNGDNRNEHFREYFRNELTRMVEGRSHHPSIIVWTLFNEGWGQHETLRYVEMLRKLDSTRLINNASGWTDFGVGHLNDHHSKFPGPESPRPDAARAAVIGSFGGLTLVPHPNNLWTPDTWGYQHVKDSETLFQTYQAMHERLRRLIRNDGLSAAVFHQLCDVESECNGLITYDREILKIPLDKVKQINDETIQFGSGSTVRSTEQELGDKDKPLTAPRKS